MSSRRLIKKSALAPTALIAGGGGFIGSHLCEALLAQGARVIVLDNFNTGNKDFVKSFLSNPKFALFDVNINSAIPVEIESVDYIFHLAGLEEYLYSKEDTSLDSLLTNSLGTKNLLDLAERSDAKFVLVSTIDVYEGMMSQLELDSYFGYSSRDQRKYSATEAKRFSEAMVWEHFKKYDTDVRIVRLPEIYGPRMDLGSCGFLGTLIQDLLHGKDLNVTGDSERKEFYLYMEDAVSGVIKSLFNKNTKGNIYSLVYGDPQKFLTTAYLLKDIAEGRIEVNIMDDLASGVRPQSRFPDTFNLGDLDWRARISFKEGILKTLDYLGYKANKYAFKPTMLVSDKARGIVPDISSISKEFDATVVSSISSTINSPTKDSSKKSLSFSIPKLNLNLKKKNVFSVVAGLGVLFSAFVVFIVTPVFSLKVNAERGLSSMQNVYNYSLKMDFTRALKESEISYNSFDRARSSFNKLKWLFSLIGEDEQFGSLDSFLSSISSFARSVNYISSSTESFGDVWEILRPDSNITLQESNLSQARTDISSAKNYLQLAQADFKQVSSKALPSIVSSKYGEYSSYLEKLSKGLNSADLLISDLSNIIGMSSTKRYMILFQNSNEIRPTGGFIGSYAILEFKDGKIANLSIDDIYNPDGQIDVRNIKVLPPKPIVDFLAEDRLYIRNANWDPDFVKSADIIKDLYYKINGVTLDGVFSMDLYFVQSILGVTGSIYLAPYNEEITSANLYERAQYHSDFDYKDGSQQKKNFLTVLGSKLLERFFALPKDKLPSLVTAVDESLKERHIMGYFSNSPVNPILTANKWSGELVSTTGDYLNIVNANLGGTKANYYVKNAYDYLVTSDTRDGLLRAKLGVTFTHTGEGDAWPGGPYTNYFRVLTQKGSKLTGAKVIYEDSSVDDVFSKVIVAKVGAYESFEFAVKIQPKTSMSILFEYDLPPYLSLTKDSKNYSFYWQKQPGTNGDKFSFAFKPPMGVVVDETIPEMSKDNIITAGYLNYDREVSIKMH